MFEPKQVQRRQLLPLAAAYVAYIVLCNLNLNINPVGFYQITKIAGMLACTAACCWACCCAQACRRRVSARC